MNDDQIGNSCRFEPKEYDERLGIYDSAGSVASPKAVECWRRTLYHAWWCGKHLWALKKQMGHGNWLDWLKRNFKGSERTARYYMRLAKGHQRPPENADITIRDALSGLTTPKGNSKKVDPDDILQSQAFKAFLRALFKKWEPEEIKYLKSSLGMDGELEEAVVKAMKKTHYEVQERLGKKSMRMKYEEARLNTLRMVRASYSD
jgi:hypothetical protein